MSSFKHTYYVAAVVETSKTFAYVLNIFDAKTVLGYSYIFFEIDIQSNLVFCQKDTAEYLPCIKSKLLSNIK